MSGITVSKKMVFPGTPGLGLGLSNDTYTDADGKELIGVIGTSEAMTEQGAVGSGFETFRSSRGISNGLRRSRDNGLTWETEEPFWQLTPETDDRVFGYIQNSICGIVRDDAKGALIRFLDTRVNFGPVFFGGGSPTYRHNRIFYQVSRDCGVTWTAPHQLVCGGDRNDKGDKFYWLDYAPGVVWGETFVQFDQPSIVHLEDGSFLLGAYRLVKDGKYRPCEAMAIRAQWKTGAEEDVLSFTFGAPISISPEQSPKGLPEPTFMKLRDGRLIAVLRSSGSEENDTWSRRFYALSEDDGSTWGPLKALLYDDGETIIVPESISKLIRSSKTGKVYWIGNIIDEPVRGCAPRNKIQIAEFDEKKLALVKDTVTIIDESPRGKGERNFSNFVLYEDRFSHDIIVLMTPGFISGEWMSEGDIDVVNGYRYEVSVV